MRSLFQRWQIPLMVVAGACFVTLLLMEIGVHIWVRWFAGHEAVRVLTSGERSGERGRTIPYLYMNYALRPDFVSADGFNRHNERGFRDGYPVPIPKPAGEFRIEVLGGSTTYGTGVLRRDLSFPALLQQILRETYHLPQVRVINMGVPGYNSWESLVAFAFRGLDLQPDLVIDNDGINDIHARIVRPDRYVSDGTGTRRPWADNSMLLRQLESPSYLVRFIVWRLLRIFPYTAADKVWNPEAPRYPIEDVPNPLLGGLTPSQALAANPPRYFLRNLRSIAAMQRVNGGEILFLTIVVQPKNVHGHYIAAPHYQRAVVEQNEAVRGLARELRAPLLDLAEIMKDSDLAFWTADGVHADARGNQRIAEILASAIHQGVEGMIARRSRPAGPGSR